MSNSFTIKANSSFEEILKQLNSQPESEWIEDLKEFTSDWFSSESSIKVKTSGSTGNPKTISLTKDQMRTSAQLTGEHFNLKPNNLAWLSLPVKYIAGKMMFVRAIELDLNLLITKPSANPMAFLGEQEVDFAAMTPMQVFSAFEDQEYEKLKQLKTLIIGGGKTGNQLKKLLRKNKINAFETYGMTETITHVATKKILSKNLNEPFVSLKGIKLGIDTNNRLNIKAKHLGSEAIQTEDIVEMMDFTKFIWLGRSNNTINSGGIKLQPENIEQKINELFTQQFIVSALPDEKLGEQVILIIEGSEFSSPTLSLLRNHLKESLDKIEVPKAIYFIDKFVETETGKIQRKATTQLILKHT